MVPFILYLIASLVTALHVYMLLTLALLGVPADAWEITSLFGSLSLFIAAHVALFRTQPAAKLALPGCLLAWFFYGPAIVTTVSDGHRGTLSFLGVMPYIALLFLSLATVYAGIVSFALPQLLSSSRWIFPNGASGPARRAVPAFSAVFLLAAVGWAGVSARKSKRFSSRFLIPGGYVGWMRVDFSSPDAPALQSDGSHYVLRFPSDGLLRTSSPEQYGWGKDQYFYDSGKGLQKLSDSKDSGVRMIWGEINGEDHACLGVRPFEEFFVGSAEQFRKQASDTPWDQPAADCVVKARPSTNGNRPDHNLARDASSEGHPKAIYVASTQVSAKP